MASVQKFSKKAIVNQLRHIERTIQNPSNTDIDKDKNYLNYSLVDHGMSSYDYYKKRLGECYVFDREDVKTTFGWVITCPEDVPQDLEDLFFANCFDFFNERYGTENCVQAVVHKDESGRSHLHYIAIPVVEDKKHEQGIKVCMNNVIDRRELRNFHADLDRFLRNRGMSCGVYTGVTAKQGVNRTVKEMKKEREIAQEVKRENRWSVERERTW